MACLAGLFDADNFQKILFGPLGSPLPWGARALVFVRAEWLLFLVHHGAWKARLRPIPAQALNATFHTGAEIIATASRVPILFYRINGQLSVRWPRLLTSRSRVPLPRCKR